MPFQITARGHVNVCGTHHTTLELTKETELTPQGDCILGVAASHACVDLPEEVKTELKKDQAIKITLKTGALEETITGHGSPDLILTNPQDLVLRKSDYIDNRTLLINCDKACADLSREFVELLKHAGQEVHFIFDGFPDLS